VEEKYAYKGMTEKQRVDYKGMTEKQRVELSDRVLQRAIDKLYER
jgi:hypothetical protein